MKYPSKLVPGLLLLALAAGPPALAQEGESEDIESLRQEIQQLKAGQAAIRRQLTEIKNLMQQRGGQARRDQVPKVTLDLAGYPSLGKASAPVTIVEFSDFQ